MERMAYEKSNNFRYFNITCTGFYGANGLVAGDRN